MNAHDAHATTMQALRNARPPAVVAALARLHARIAAAALAGEFRVEVAPADLADDPSAFAPGSRARGHLVRAMEDDGYLLVAQSPIAMQFSWAGPRAWR